jgi:hypothetical protein
MKQQLEAASPPLSPSSRAAPRYGAAPPASRVATAIAARRAYGPPLTPEPLRPLTQQRHGQAHSAARKLARRFPKSLQPSLYGFRGLPKYIGRVGGLTVAFWVGVAIAATPAISWLGVRDGEDG